MNVKHDKTNASLRGMALLLVLGSLVLLSALLLAFISGVSTELKSSKFYADGSSVKTLADSTVNVLMAQLRQATSGVDTDGNVLAWASQPGMIRTYDSSGQPAVNYKLYSWDTFQTTGGFDPAASAESVPDDWFDHPALYVDLNRPVEDSDNISHYPILDPPPLSPAAPYYVEGFSVQDAPVQSTTGNTVPMPVKWLYVLENGSIVAAVPTGNGKEVRVTGAEQSPIVGRIAFWTDDETCKININTASEGSFWDTPRTIGLSDFTVAKFQPQQREYQRYPGHPATTCLSPVLGSLFPVNHTLRARNTAIPYNPGAANTATYAPYQPYFDLAPRLNINVAGNLGSEAGTVPPADNGNPLSIKNDRLYASLDELLFKSNLITDNGHTTSFAGTREFTRPTLDKTMLKKARFFLTNSSRSPDENLFNKPRIVTWPVAVTNSPVYRTPMDQAIAFCGQIGKGSDGNPFLYYFQRQRNDHPTNDLPSTPSVSGLGRNRMLLQYLRDLTGRPVPGFGGSFQAKYPGPERDQILTQLFDYIRCLNLIDQSSSAMTRPFAPIADTANGYHAKYTGNSNLFPGQPTFTSSLYGARAGAGQVVPIYDGVTQTKGFGRFPTISEVSLVFINTAWNDGHGGRSTDVNYRTDTPVSAYPASVTGITGYEDASTVPPVTDPCGPGEIKVQAVLLVSFFDPSQGNVETYGTYSIEVEGLNAFQWGANSGAATNMGFPANPLSKRFAQAHDTTRPYLTQNWGGNMGFRSFFANGNPFISTTKRFPYDPATPNNGQNSSSPGTFYFSGGSIKVHVLVPGLGAIPGWPLPATAGGRVPVQTIELEFPSATLPLPIYPGATVSNTYGGTGPKSWQTRSMANRLSRASYKEGPNATFLTAYDTVRSLRAYPGDIRLIAARPRISFADAAGYFDMGENTKIFSFNSLWEYGSSSKRLVHSLREGCDYPFWGALLGQLVPGTSYYGGTTNGGPTGTNIEFGLNSLSTRGNHAAPSGAFLEKGGSRYPGDWDNGFAFTSDGPYINKADEGNISYITSTSGADTPYFDNINFPKSVISPTYFSPNRLMPSPVMFGSLPTGVSRNLPWQTLLFSPNPAAGPEHPGFATPPDYLMLDLFNMPVVEPYPISEPLSTAGRINMNYQIVPFTYIKRNTGMRAVLKSEWMTLIPDNAADQYKRGGGTSINPVPGNAYDFRVPINVDETLKAFDHHFEANKDIFRSAAQICSMFLYPQRGAAVSSSSGPQWNADNSNILRFWNGQTGGAGYTVNTTSGSATHYLTGDNSKERPYATIYPRLTTKSNTFTVHVHVQTLKKVVGTPRDIWMEGRDQVTGEYRGYQTIERYIDPNDKNIPDYADPSVTAPISDFYKIRVLASKQFAP